jgi:hypothetical protein
MDFQLFEPRFTSSLRELLTFMGTRHNPDFTLGTVLISGAEIGDLLSS